MSLPTPEPAAVAAFWATARPALGLSGPVPQAWAFGGTAEQAEHDRGFSPTMPVVLQSFEVLFTG